MGTARKDTSQRPQNQQRRSSAAKSYDRPLSARRIRELNAWHRMYGPGATTTGGPWK